MVFPSYEQIVRRMQPTRLAPPAGHGVEGTLMGAGLSITSLEAINLGLRVMVLFVTIISGFGAQGWNLILNLRPRDGRNVHRSRHPH